MKRVVRDTQGNAHVLFDVTLAQYRKKPVVVFAALMDEPFEVETLEGTMHGNAGDYLVRGDDGEFYPCKPSIFAATYETARVGR
jgi:hypothetical protein